MLLAVLVQLGALLFFLSGCSSSQPDSSFNPPSYLDTKIDFIQPPDFIQHEEKNNLTAELDRAKNRAAWPEIKCANLNDCPPNVGILTSFSAEATSPTKISIDLAQCSATLIAPDLVLTNQHCLPKNIAILGANCQGRIWIGFPSTLQLASQTVGCDRVVFLSQPHLPQGIMDIYNNSNRIVADAAIIRLQQPLTRPVAKLSFEGIPDKSKLVAYVANPLHDPQRLAAEISPLYCLVRQRPVFASQINHELNPVAALIECPIVSGNSGSALFDELGRVPAILQSSRAGIDFEGRERKLFSKTAFATNVACLDLPAPWTSLTKSRAPQCQEPALHKISNDEQLFIKQLQAALPDAQQPSAMLTALGASLESLNSYLIALETKINHTIATWGQQKNPQFKWHFDLLNEKTNGFAADQAKRLADDLISHHPNPAESFVTLALVVQPFCLSDLKIWQHFLNKKSANLSFNLPLLLASLSIADERFETRVEWAEKSIQGQLSFSVQELSSNQQAWLAFEGQDPYTNQKIHFDWLLKPCGPQNGQFAPFESLLKH